MKTMSPVRTFGDRDSGPFEHEAGEWATRKSARSPDELVELFSGEVWRFTSSQISRREDAEDIVQEVFAAAFQNYAKVDRMLDQRLWLLTVARNKVASLLRQRYRRSEEPLSDEHSFEASMESTELQHAVRRGILGLPQPQAEVLVLKYVNGLSTEEVSQVIRKSLPATNSLLQRARSAFREALGPTFADYARSM
jgi:RNA polymerase sigma factor (sigma-70 family)